MKIDASHEIRIVAFVIDKDGNTSDCYDNYEELCQQHPTASYDFGYVVFNTTTNSIPPTCNDWNDSIQDAFRDYLTNVLCLDDNAMRAAIKTPENNETVRLEETFEKIRQMEITPFGTMLDFLIEQGLTKEQAIKWFDDAEK